MRVNLLGDVQAIFLINPVTGTQQLSLQDIRLITHKAGLKKADLNNLFEELSISSADQDNGRHSANTEDFKLQSSTILQAWVQNQGSAATRDRIIEAIRECELIHTMEFLEREWVLGLTTE